MNNKPRVVKDYIKLDKEVKQMIKLHYPEGFEGHLIKFVNKDGNTVSALPFETNDFYYLIKMTVTQAQEIIEDDDDYDDDGFLKEEVREEYEGNIAEEDDEMEDVDDTEDDMDDIPDDDYDEDDMDDDDF
ncbi:MAG: hypothetical protein H3C31_00600 [Brumimicrobium sp.]|nr:hypothetical protein [Brumimicrobium sp.]MCO5268141.1 hypothetical protein [Brumimicrobium sp.]